MYQNNWLTFGPNCQLLFMKNKTTCVIISSEMQNNQFFSLFTALGAAGCQLSPRRLLGYANCIELSEQVNNCCWLRLLMPASIEKCQQNGCLSLYSQPAIYMLPRHSRALSSSISMDMPAHIFIFCSSQF